ncbi:MAG: cytochrome c biogenesis protein ResB [Firmicutes bacterium]|nr:cytochrome c biogenesis protein ResB [Bacillota bacterium]
MAKNNKTPEPGIAEQNTSPGEPEASSKDSNIINTVWNFLSSMKLGIILLLVLAVVSIIGTVWVPTDPLTGQQDFAKFYNTWFFRILLGLLALNLLVCSLNRWKAVTNTLKGPGVNFSENFVKSLKSVRTIKLKGEPTQTAERVKDLLKKQGYRIFSKQDGDTVRISSDRGHLGILGPYLTHLSFIIMIVAIVIKFSGLVGFDGMMSGVVGQTVNLSQVQGIQNMDSSEYFDLRINNFRTEYRPDGSVKQWYSDVTVLDKGNTFDYSIYVNHPLIYKGLKFYQMSYGSQFSGKYTGPSVTDQPFAVGVQQYIQPAGTDITFIPMSFDNTTRKILFQTYKGNNQVAQQEVALNTPYKYEQAEVKFEKAEAYTVLSVKKDPGVPIIGAGSILLIAGVIISFLLRQRRIWSVISPEKDGSLVQIGGISAKDKRGLDSNLDAIVSEFKS